MFTKRVNLDGRQFTVVFDDSGKPLRIRERKLYAPGKPWEAWGESSYWSAKHHAVPKKSTSIVARVLAAALIP